QTCPPRPERDRSNARLNAKGTTRFHECAAVLAPALLIKVRRKKKARLIPKHRVNARDERLAGLIRSRQMPSDDLVGQRQKLSILTFRALDARLLADTANPFVAARWRIARSSGFAAFEPSGINIISPTEERAKESDF